MKKLKNLGLSLPSVSRCWVVQQFSKLSNSTVLYAATPDLSGFVRDPSQKWMWYSMHPPFTSLVWKVDIKKYKNKFLLNLRVIQLRAFVRLYTGWALEDDTEQITHS